MTQWLAYGLIVKMEHRDVYLNWINGQWKQGGSGQWLENRNPAKPSEILGKMAISSTSDVERAVSAAITTQTAWNEKPRSQRAHVLGKMATLLKGRIEVLAKSLTREHGQNLAASRAEISLAIARIENYAAQGRLTSSTSSTTESGFSWREVAPYGVVAIIGGSTQPFLRGLCATASALIEGNGVLFKPSSLVPGIAVQIVRTWEEAGLPPGILNLVFGPGKLICPALALDPRVDLIHFSGSADNALALQSTAATRPVQLKLQPFQNSVVAVLADADVELAADRLTWGAFSHAGQYPDSPRVVVVEQSVYAALSEALITRLKSIRLGDGNSEPECVGPMVEVARSELFQESVQSLLSGGLKNLGVGPAGPAAGYATPTVLQEPRIERLLENTASAGGPLLILTTVDGKTPTLDWATRLASATPRFAPLSLSVFTRDPLMVARFPSVVRAGSLHLNELPSSPQAAFDPTEFSRIRVITIAT